MPHFSALATIGAGVAAAAAVVLAPASASAAPPCDAYSKTCVKPTRIVTPGPTVRPTRDTDPDVLPFTGAQLTMMLAVGAVGIGGGAALTAAGRKRRHQA